jgi:serine/threonine-protein kinase
MIREGRVVMSQDASPSDLLIRWQEAREKGEPLSPQELCKECPALLPELHRQIDRLGRMEQILARGTPCMTVPDVGGTTVPYCPTDSSASLPPLDYDLVEELGHGGMGVVYRARQVSLNRPVALKVLRSAVAVPADLARFRAEAVAVARLPHPNIVQIYDLGESKGQPYFSMELLEGGSLARRLRGHPLPPRQAAQLVEVLARAMDVAHRHGIVHRDLKPSNILLAGTPDTPLAQCVPKITDFGLVKRLDMPAGLTTRGAVMGTPAYMAPEQAAGRNRDVGPVSDVYGLGAILYECLTGRPPFKAPTLMETLEQVRFHEPIPPSRLRPRVPHDLETICLHCLHKEMRQRYGSALELADDLKRYLGGDRIHAGPAGCWERVRRWTRRRPLAGLLAGVSAAVLIGVLLSVGGGWARPLTVVAGGSLSLLVAAWWYNTRLRAALGEVREQHATAERHVERLHLLLETTTGLVAAPDQDTLLRLLSETAARLANADRATIYLVDPRSRELWSRVALGESVGEIRLPLGVGIAGTVASTGETINLPEAESDPRFNPEIDRRTGYKTRNMLTLPMVSPQGKVVGVFQLLNKRGSPFTAEDVEVLSLLAGSAAVAVENTWRFAWPALPGPGANQRENPHEAA